MTQQELMIRNAVNHAELLRGKYGVHKAQEITASKLADAPWMVPSSLDSGVAFWRRVAEHLCHVQTAENES